MSRSLRPPLPQELLDAIIDLLATDWRSQAACALVPSSKTDRARSRLCRGVTVTLRRPQDGPDDAHDFMDVFSPDSSLKELPLTLLIGGGGRRHQSNPFLPDALKLDHLRNIRSLKLFRVDIPAAADGGVGRLRSLYSSLERLEELFIDRVSILGPSAQPEAEVSGHIANHGEQPEIPLPRGMPSLKVLRIHRLKTPVRWGSPPIHPAIAAVRDDIMFAPSPSALHTLSLHEIVEDHALSPWARVVARSCDTLREVRVTVSRALAPSDEHGALFYTALGECRHLERFCLAVWVSLRDESSVTTIPILTTALGALPTYTFTRRLPHLSLAFLCKSPRLLRLDTSQDSESLAEFARIFARDAYPALTDLQVAFYGGPLDYKELWMPEEVASAGVPAMEDVVHRISTALNSMRDAGVRVDVRRGQQATEDFLRNFA